MIANHREFDDYAQDYDAALGRGISLSGESREYFAQGRIRWLARCLRALNQHPAAALDFGCGTGTTAALLLEHLRLKRLVGLDPSAKSLEIAQRTAADRRVAFHSPLAYRPNGDIDLVYCNGVFHHIVPDQRPAVLDYLKRCLRSGGLLALWENNPWNPATRVVMKRIPFDRDAVTLSPFHARNMLRSGGFTVVRLDFLFIFPRVLSGLRFIEPFVAALPLGAQYQVLCRKTP